MTTPSMQQVDALEQEFRAVQDHITSFLSSFSGQVFEETEWPYTKGKGGGRTRVLEVDRRHYLQSQGGNASPWELRPERTPRSFFEKGACNFSGIHGDNMPKSATSALNIPENTPYRATGVSLIFHPSNPYVPTIHMNVRFFICGEKWWFGGGIDVTPTYPILEQAIAFHADLKQLCDAHHVPYGEWKEWCDKYFFLPHRNETRGIGGIFYDHFQGDSFEHAKNFTMALGRTFNELYSIFLPNGNISFTIAQREFQLYRRGRYVEFNLAYDRGTKFGLMSNGRAESILVSLPATVHWVYEYKPPAGSKESYLYDHFLKPQSWLALTDGDKAQMQPPPNFVGASKSSFVTMPSKGLFASLACPAVLGPLAFVVGAAAAVCYFKKGGCLFCLPSSCCKA
ncbi:coproporphyrinogen III oxidase [Salpingoeca rosetta]|uniref:coproporphyrinogen oxidase n=1 Tax=Salpingoeca rosetta (strain ATCC 50818 / BSB-021) TaxID=946362 RepID=F2U8N0_SALR5|nr:coproporphyrinogen III oxidase [Salpingoeca rosetta]EGD72738.1 coproporphyrinogen III oxidase [Salpingoeca rosetta]|eukprot:XP_004994561.1 coproporphyrinogen III oxidase [Salpingoeca rosetta]